MFGYIAPYRPELKLREDAEYRAYYCGLCKALGIRRGLIGRAVLRYDMAFVLLLADAIAQEGDALRRGVCALHPLRRTRVSEGAATEFVADLSVILLWGKLADDKRDGDAAGALLPIASAAAKRAMLRRPHIKALVDKLLADQEEIEFIEASPDEAAEPTALFMQGLFEALPGLPSCDMKAAGWLGYNMGKWIYLMDALDDRERDAKRGHFNPLTGVDPARADFLLTHCAAQAEAAFTLLTLNRHEGVLTNILSLGLNGMKCAVTEGKRGKGLDDGSI